MKMLRFIAALLLVLTFTGVAWAQSPNGTIITPGAGSFTDGTHTYTINTTLRQVVEDGTAINNSGGTAQGEWCNSQAYFQDAASGSWYTWNQTAFIAAAAPTCAAGGTGGGGTGGAGKTSPPTPLTGAVSTQTWLSFDKTFSGVTLPSGKAFHFNLLPPAQDNETAYKYPLLVWLHPTGSGNAWYNGSNTNPLFYVPNEPANFNTVSFLTNYPGYVLVGYADQTCAGGDAICNWGGWINNGLTGSGTVNSGDTGPNVFALLGAINFVEQTYSIDTSRVYCEGFSLGGIGCEYLLLKYNAYNGNPAVFAAGSSSGGVLEIHGSGAGPTAGDATTMANVPVWWFSGANDGASIPSHWNLPMWRLEAGNSSYPGAITSAAANRAGTSQMHLTLCATCGHQETDSAGNPVYTNPVIMNWMFGTVASTGTGAFRVSGGQILDPGGKRFFAQGINGYSTSLPNPTTMMATFPGTNFFRYIVRNMNDPTTYDAFVNALPGVVIEFEHHPNGGGDIDPSPPDSTIAQESAWYASMATHFKNNPYVWFGTYNEPQVTTPGLSNWQRATYDAIRTTAGSNAPLLIEVAGSRPVNLQQGLVPATYATMTNVMWDAHIYGYQNNFATDSASIAANITGMITAAQTVTSADGTMPVIIGESGPSTTGGSPADANGQATVNGLIAAATARQMAGYIPFTWWPGFASPNDLTLGDNSVTSPYGTSVKTFLAATAVVTESLSVNSLPSVAANTAFTVSGAIANAAGTPVLQYQNNNGAWTAFPANASVSQISYTFTDPGLATAGTSNNTVSVRDANNTSVVATSNAFTVTGGESANNTVVTVTLAVPTFSDNFTSLSLHQAWQTGDNWQLIAPDTPNGRGGPTFNENGDQWWTNPFNPSTPISGLYTQDSSGLHLGLKQTPAAQQSYITSSAGSALPYVGALLNTSQTSSQKYGYWEITAAVPKVPGFTYQADIENVQVTGQFPPEIDLRISTNAAGVQTVLFEFALSGGGYTQYTTSSSAGFDASVSHTYGWDWESNFITLYIDNVQAFQAATPTAGNYNSNPMFLFMLTGANYIGTGDPSAASLPVSAQVTSVNVYAAKPAAASSGSIVNATGEIWTITSGEQVAVNGVTDTATSSIIELAYVNHAVWKETAGGVWQYKTKASDTWLPAGGTTTSPLTITESSSGTIVTTVGPVITDANGVTFAITAGAQISIGGVTDTATSGVVELAYVNHVLWQKNSAGNWYNYLGTPGSYGGPTTVSPLSTEIINVDNIATQANGVAFTVTGNVDGVSGVPALQYQDNSGSWTAFPAGSIIALSLPPAFNENFNPLDITDNGSGTAWMNHYPFGGAEYTLPANNEAQCYTSITRTPNYNPFSLVNGIFTITTDSVAHTVSNGCNLPYNSGAITSATEPNGSPAPGLFSQAYGYFAAKMLLPAGTGLWPAFWLEPVNGTSACEIDIMEALGNDLTHVYTTIHYTGNTSADSGTATVSDYSQNWHEYAVDWETDFITWYIDGAQVFQRPTPASCNTPAYILSNLAVGAIGSWPGPPNANTVFPAKMQIAYIKAYASKPASGSGTAATYSFINPGLSPGATNTVSVRDAANTNAVGSSNGFAVNSGESLSIDPISAPTANTVFTVSGRIAGASVIPTLQYQNNGGAWLALPSGANVTLTSFNFTNPGLAINPAATVSVRDANATATTATATFTVIASGTASAAWNATDTSPTITLTNSGLIAQSTSTAQGGSRAATSHTTGAYCYDITGSTITANLAVGLSNATFALAGTIALGADANSAGFYPAQSGLLQGALYNGVQIIAPVTVAAASGSTMTFCENLTTQKEWVSTPYMRAGVPTATLLASQSGGALTDNVGAVWTIVGGQAFRNGSLPVFSANVTEIVLVNNVIWSVNTSNQWYFYTVSPASWTAGNNPIYGGTWNNSATADPATGVGGGSFSGLNCPCYPTFTTRNIGTQVTLNTSGPFAVALPVGFQAWQTAPVLIHHPFLFNMGQNEPANDNNFYVPARFESIAR